MSIDYISYCLTSNKLIHCDFILFRTAYTKNWQPIEDETILTGYSRPLHSLARAVLLSLDNHPSHYKFPLTDASKFAAKDLLDLLDNSDATIEDKIKAFHAFVYPFLTIRSVTDTFSKWDDVLECFLAIYHIKSDGNFNTINDVTQLFVKFKYHCRASVLYESFQRVAGFKNNLNR